MISAVEYFQTTTDSLSSSSQPSRCRSTRNFRNLDWYSPCENAALDSVRSSASRIDRSCRLRPAGDGCNYQGSPSQPYATLSFASTPAHIPLVTDFRIGGGADETTFTGTVQRNCK